MSILWPCKGCRVTRGSDWCYGNKDGGVGHIGTVTQCDPGAQVCSVVWDYGLLMEGCRAGQAGNDLRIIDTSLAKYEHNLNNADCDTCDSPGQRATITGYRWKCAECRDFDLCNLCYMQGKHDLTHHFMRFDNSLATVVPVPPRKRSKKLKVYSMMKEAQVKRSRRKGTDSEIGVIKEVTESGGDQVVEVEWKSGETTTHIAGPHQKFDLVSAHSTVSIYIDHIPLADFSRMPDSHINVGDTVRVDLNIDTFKCLQTEYGGWQENMEKVLGEMGTVQKVARMSVLVYFEVVEQPWCVFTNACQKISVAEVGDHVKVLDNQMTVKGRQDRHGGWRENMKEILGKVGEVEKVHSSGDLTVNFQSAVHLLNPSCCVKVMNSSQLPPKVTDTKSRTTTETETVSGGNLVLKTEDVKEKQKERKSEEGKEDGRTAEQKSSSTVEVKVTRDIESKEEDGVGVDDHTEDEDTEPFLQWLISTDYDDMMDPGVRVVRGKDWKWGEQDGGEGNVGTVVLVGDQETASCPLQCAIVQWDSGYRNAYRAGFENAYDLRIYDTAPIGIRHPGVTCRVCKECDLMGFVWQCEKQPDTILCNTCYHGDKLDVTLSYLRINKPGDTGVRANKRQMSKQILAKGVFEGARVARGPDWMWEDQDKNGNGKVIALVNFSLDTDHDAVEVMWDTGDTNVYRHGYEGKLDIKCMVTATAGTYYRDQLPDFKVVIQEAAASVSEAGMDRLIAGDAVRIGVDPEVLQAIHKSQNMWNESMIDCIGKIGEVVVQSGEDVTVKFDIGSWTFKEMSLDKVKQLKKGETVRVRDNEQEVKELQNGHGDWNEKIRQTLGKKGRVHSIDRYGDIVVAFGPVKFQFNASVLDPADGEADVLSDNLSPGMTSSVRLPSSSPAITPVLATGRSLPPRGQGTKTTEEQLRELEEAVKNGDAGRVRNLLQLQLGLKDLGKPALIVTASALGHTEVVKVMVSLQCNLEVQNDEDTSRSNPLLTAVRHKHRDVAEVLLHAGVRKDVSNSHGQTAVHIAVQEKDIDMLALLQDNALDINQKDNLGDSAITDAISTGNERFIDMVVNWKGVQLNYYNRLDFSPLLFAARKGEKYAIQKILQKEPGLLNSQKSDGFTALHLSACQDHVDIVRLLVGMPMVNKEARTERGWTPLHVAALHQSVKTINLFLGLDDQRQPVTSTRPLVDIDSVDDSRNNALHFCLRGEDLDTQQQSLPAEDIVQKQIEIALKMIHCGVQYSARNNQNRMPLDECSNDRVKERVRTALQEKDVHPKIQPTPTPSGVCMSCDEDPANYELLPCHCFICNECGARKARKCPNCATGVEDRRKVRMVA